VGLSLAAPSIGKMLVVLRDGRKLHGVLRSYDQFGSLPKTQKKLQQLTPHQPTSFWKTRTSGYTTEAPTPRTGTGSSSSVGRTSFSWVKSHVFHFLPRITPTRLTVVLLVKDLDREDEVPLRRVDYGVLEPYHRQDSAVKKEHDEFKAQVLYEQKGYCREGGEGDGY
jgi:U6 snRNA-associated Sm-like protein LSm1